MGATPTKRIGMQLYFQKDNSDKGAYLPTEEEIARATEEIRSQWTESQALSALRVDARPQPVGEMTETPDPVLGVVRMRI